MNYTDMNDSSLMTFYDNLHSFHGNLIQSKTMTDLTPGELVNSAGNPQI